MTPLVESDVATTTLPSTDGDDQNTEEPGSAEGAEDSTLPYDWTGDVESLVLTSHGLAIDMDALAVLVAEHDDAADEEAELGADAEVDALAASDSDTEAGESESAAERLAGMLPEAVDGELELELTLDPAAGDEGNDRLAIEPGDYFTVDMPEGVALTKGEAFDVFQADGEAGGDNDKDGRGDAQITLDTTSDHAAYTIAGLPKYDNEGNNVHYTVKELWGNETDHGDYYSSIVVGDYVVAEGKRHFEDSQQVDLINSRSDTRDVSFYVQWYDNFVNTDLNQRPDVHLVLYKVVDGGEPVRVDSYLNTTWSLADGSDDPTRLQKVPVTDLPEYDSEGRKITYFASQIMSADGSSLDYVPVQFSSAEGQPGPINIRNVANALTRETSDQQFTFATTSEAINLSALKAEDGTTYRLVAGKTYTLTEAMGPDGHCALAPFEFTVNADGTIAPGKDMSWAKDGKAGYAVDELGTSLTAYDASLDLSITKRDESGKFMSGAAFMLTPAEDSTFVDGFCAEAVVLETDSEGGAAVDPSILIAGNTYELTEHAAPAGYELAGTVKFKIGMDGSISIVDAPEDGSATLGEGGSGSYLVVDDNPGAISIVVTDTPIGLSLDKVNLRGEKLAGATFEITGVFADGSTESTKTVEVGGDGTISLPRMKAGETYGITELEASGGYKLIQGSFTFTVNAAGTISAVDNTTTQNASGTWLSAGYAVSGDGDELVAVDAPVPSPTPGGDSDDPDTPEDPDDPYTPDTPEEPEDPEDPDTPDPDEPDTPEDPDKPEGPDTPDTPSTPDDSVTPDAGADADRPGAAGDSSAGSTNRSDLPQSGDRSWQVACIAAGGTAVLAAGLAVRAKRKRSNTR